MSLRLQGQTVIVTGAGSGYGYGIAKKLKAEGADVVIADISQPRGEHAAGQLSALFVKTDVTDRIQWQNLLQKTLEKYGSLDIVVNNAGICYDKKASDTVSEQEFDSMMNVNVKSIFQSTAVIAPFFQSQGEGVFVNIASTSAIRPRPGM